MAELCGAAAEACIERLLAINPYLEIAESEARVLRTIYEDSLRAIIVGGEPAATLRDRHVPRICTWVGTLYPARYREALKDVPTLSAIPYSECSAALQLELLRIESSAVDGPVLDIGCGAHGKLVRELRSRGVDAQGIDRTIEAVRPWLAEASWRDLDLPACRYGLIVSHLAFSSHYRHHQSSGSPALDLYAERYRAILSALRPGGSFRYTPALPEQEGRLDPSRYALTQWEVVSGVLVSSVIRRP